jgi:hypothetical protein
MKPKGPGVFFAFAFGEVHPAEVDELGRVGLPSREGDMSGVVWCYGDRIPLPPPPVYQQGELWPEDEA